MQFGRRLANLDPVLRSGSAPDDGSRRLAERLRLLADAGMLLSATPDVESTLGSLTRLTVQWFAHASVVQLFDGRAVTASAVAACDPALEAATRAAIRPCERDHAQPADSLRQVLDTCAPALARHVDENVLRSLSANDTQFEAIRRLSLTSVIRAPLLARSRVLGVLTLGRVRGPPFDEDDLALGAELGRRAGLAFDNALLLRRANDAIKLRDEFLAIASHELNTPLTPLRMHLDMLRRGHLPPERVEAKLEAASRQVTRLTRLVETLLDVSRISEGKLKLELEEFDLAALVDEVVEHLAEDAQRSGSVVRVTAQRPCMGRWDRIRLDEVITNLLSNALKYGCKQPVDIDVTHGEKLARLVIRDHGIGIPGEYHQRIFERLERAASIRHYGGFGLGLWIAWRIVDACRGTISVESEPDKGAAFTVELPRNLTT